MQIVINIDDEDYDDITLTGENTINLGVLLDLREAVRKGTPLLGHGRLIDADKYLETERPRGLAEETWKESHIYKSIMQAPTVLEAESRKV